MNEEKKVMNEEAKKEVRDLFEGAMGTQIDGLESYLRDLYKIGEANDNHYLMSRCMTALRAVNNIRFEFQAGIDLDNF